jgi:hypothetical protein
MLISGAETGRDYVKESRQLLRAELTRRGITYKRLAEMMKERGYDETEKSVSHKITRGTYRMTFFLTVCDVIGSPVTIRLDRHIGGESEIDTNRKSDQPG